MTRKNKLWIYSLIVLGFVLTLTNGCKKEDTKIDPVITWDNPADITYGTLLSAIQLNATADVSGTFVYTPAIGTKLNEGANQNLKVDFTPTDSINYNTASKTVTINVTAQMTVTDIEGNVYKTVSIGSQVWMAENLKTTKYRNGDPIPNITDETEWPNLSTGAYCDYDNIPGNGVIYGKLYNWFAVDDSRNIAPNGWHVPTYEDYTILENYLIANGYNYDGSKDEDKIAKSLASTTNWASSTVVGTIGNDLTKNNSAGFSALPGGFLGNDGVFYYIGESCSWWCSSSGGSTSSGACYRGMRYVGYGLDSGGYYKVCGFSVRLVKD
jgi:uncharacterized protein (TIGR02145 family)